MPPARRVSSCLEPVVMEMSSERRWCISVAVVKPMGTSLEAGSDINIRLCKEYYRVVLPSARIFVAFCSEIPLTCSKTRRGL